MMECPLKIVPSDSELIAEHVGEWIVATERDGEELNLKLESFVELL